MKRVLAFLLVLLFAAPALAQDVWFTGNWEDAQKLAKKEGKMILIDFFQDG
ncbi:MAG: hypothetical protein GY863_03070 [bacterium]|nr:hypothetical protein [bacterium]